MAGREHRLDTFPGCPRAKALALTSQAAKGEAQAIELQARTINAQGGESYLRLEAIRKWNGRMPVYLGSHTPLPFVDVGVGGK